MKLSPTIAILVSLIASVPVARSQNTDLLDGVCKSEPLPAGFVPVAEVDSPECEAVKRGEKNGWLIDKVKDGIVACVPPNLKADAAPAVAYIPCSREFTDQCPARFDGGPNGYKLTFPKSCRGFYNQYCYSDDELNRMEVAVIDLQKDSDQCVEDKSRPHHVKLSGNIAHWPICIANNWHLIKRINEFNLAGSPAVIYRVFYSDACPEDPTFGRTAFIQEYFRERGGTRFSCSLAFPRKGSSGIAEFKTQWRYAFTAKSDAPTYRFVRTFSSEMCGEADYENAMDVQYN
ncbi:hypothetical protein [Sinorhizobium meliloti]|jgi:hypothetical protein|uniref:hypothetical protein n=1 Tax=Rhizobium meliloti TaxID=382 RepID=UPI0020C10F13|nr:hypothetical protein [Sinorhizobium meliloti]